MSVEAHVRGQKSATGFFGAEYIPGVCRYNHICTCGGWVSTVGIFASHKPTFETESLTKARTHCCVGRLSSKTLGSFCLYFPILKLQELTAISSHVWLLHGCLGSKFSPHSYTANTLPSFSFFWAEGLTMSPRLTSSTNFPVISLG